MAEANTVDLQVSKKLLVYSTQMLTQVQHFTSDPCLQLHLMLAALAVCSRSRRDRLIKIQGLKRWE